jgi:uncharacterized protein (TIGR02145 family)
VNTPKTFAPNPFHFGMHYQWDRNVGWSTTDPIYNSNGGTIWEDYVYPTPVCHNWKKENDPCPTGWRVPTKAEMETLISTYDHYEKINEVWVYIFVQGDNKLYLPSAGYRNGSGSLAQVNGHGNYWTSTGCLEWTNSAFFFKFYNSDPYISDNATKSEALSVRCIKE